MIVEYPYHWHYIENLYKFNAGFIRFAREDGKTQKQWKPIGVFFKAEKTPTKYNISAFIYTYTRKYVGNGFYPWICLVWNAWIDCDVPSRKITELRQSKSEHEFWPNKKQSEKRTKLNCEMSHDIFFWFIKKKRKVLQSFRMMVRRLCHVIAKLS